MIMTITMIRIITDGDQVRSVYHACMNEPLIEEIGLQPLKDKLRSMGGWPVLEVILLFQRICKEYLLLHIGRYCQYAMASFKNGCRAGK